MSAPQHSDIVVTSTGVLLGHLDHSAVAYDLRTEMLHHISITAHALLEEAIAPTPVDELVAALAMRFGADAEVVASDVHTARVSLTQHGLLGSTAPIEAPVREDAAADPTGTVVGQVHPVLDDRIRFRGTNEAVVRALDEHLGTAQPGLTDAPDTDIEIGVASNEATAEVTLSLSSLVNYPSLASALDGAATLLNRFAVTSPTCLALHAGGLRSPDGGVVLVTGPSGSGKSTLTAGLVRAGFDYLGDEAIGVRPGSLVGVGYPKLLALSAASRAVLDLPESDQRHTDPSELRANVQRLAGDVGPIERVIIASYEPDQSQRLSDLGPKDAFEGLLANTLNLAHLRQPGLNALCQLAETVGVHRLRHQGALDAAQVVAALT